MLEPFSSNHQRTNIEFKIRKWLEFNLKKTPDLRFHKVLFNGQENNLNILVLEQPGRTLREIYKKEGVFSVKTVLLLGHQLVSRIEALHSARVVHRNITPSSIYVSPNKQDTTLFLTNFNFAKKYVTSNGKHIPFKLGKGMVGCARYCSLSCSKYEEISRKDDLENLMYLLIYLNMGTLPWQGLGKNEKIRTIATRYKAIRKIKMSVNFNELTKDWPPGVEDIIRYLREVEFD